jgi:hypothetical protein
MNMINTVFIIEHKNQYKQHTEQHQPRDTTQRCYLYKALCSTTDQQRNHKALQHALQRVSTGYMQVV